MDALTSSVDVWTAWKRLNALELGAFLPRLASATDWKGYALELDANWGHDWLKSFHTLVLQSRGPRLTKILSYYGLPIKRGHSENKGASSEEQQTTNANAVNAPPTKGAKEADDEEDADTLFKDQLNSVEGTLTQLT